MQQLAIIVGYVTIVVTLGMMFYAFLVARTVKGGMLERGMKLLAFSPIFLILSIIAENLLPSSEQTFDIVNDILLFVFVLCSFLGWRSIIGSWRNLSK